MNLTPEQRDAVLDPRNVALTSCPGSGKTRTIVAKLLRCIDEVRDSTRRVACITYTNTAVDEIDLRLRQHCFSGEERYYEVSTIHTFCLHNILRPFHTLLPEFRSGFTLISADEEAYTQQVRRLVNEYGVQQWALEGFERIHREPGGAIFVPDGIPFEAAQDLCRWLDGERHVALSDVVYHANRLLQLHEFIGSSVASRFKWILVDEFQDSSAGQVILLEKIHSFSRTRFFCVGDPNQSIFGFAGARSTLMAEFAVKVEAKVDYRLTGNFRSSSRIVDCAENLCPTFPPMKAVGKYRNHPEDPIHIHTTELPPALLRRFIPKLVELKVPYGDAAILAPWWVPLYRVARELRSRCIPIIGPGARPYRRSHILSQLAEPMCAYIESQEPDIAVSVQRALFITLLETTGQSEWKVFSYTGKRVVCQLLHEAIRIRYGTNDAGEWLREAAIAFTDILLREGFLPTFYRTALVESAQLMCSDISKRAAGTEVKVEDLGLFARPKRCLQMLTMHRAKGREFEAVAIIDAHDGRLPHFSIRNIIDPGERASRFEEARRLMYVAATRAKRVLMIFTDESDARNKPSPFLREMGLS